MDFGAVIGAHGYWLLAVGCLLEGETILVLAGFAAHRGYLDPVAVIGVASVAGFLGDQFYFWLGRRYGQRVLVRWPSVGHQATRLHRLIDRRHSWVIVGVRFAYGLRIAGPLLIGMSPVPALRFAVLNAIGALLWACMVGGVGWVFGRAAEMLLGEIRHLEGWLLLALLAATLAVWWIRKYRAR